MNLLQNHFKLFGVALDASDDPLNLELKRTWMLNMARERGSSIPLDPYDALTDFFGDSFDNRLKFIGKFPIPSWLSPRPEPEDYQLVNTTKIADFYDTGSLDEINGRLQTFIEEKIFPAVPIMAGVDHSASAGVLSALSNRYGQEDLCVIMLDQHFDAIPLSVRLENAHIETSQIFTNLTRVNSSKFAKDKTLYNCGDFMAHLIDKEIILANNVLYIGVANYPAEKNLPAEKNAFDEIYIKYEEQGCSFFPLNGFAGDYIEDLTQFIDNKITKPYVYISLDLDVGSFNSTFAARYMDKTGLSQEALIGIAGIIYNKCNREHLQIAGIDIMELNIHFLGIETPGGIKDMTSDLVKSFLMELIK